MFTAPPDAPTFQTPNALMHTLASPSLGGGELAVWRVEMEPGAQGPVHETDREQAWVVLEGELEVTIEGVTRTVPAGQTVTVASGAERQVRAPTRVVALVSSGAPTAVSTPDGGTRPLPWAA